MALKHSYTLIAPFYDLLVRRPLESARRSSLQRLPDDIDSRKILINGIGSGLDIPYLPPAAHYTGTDITPAMLQRARANAARHNADIEFHIADSHRLPFPDQSFDIVIMHLILAVVPQPGLALQEAERVLKRGGSILIFDKFLRPGEFAPLRRIINVLLRHIATRTDVVFEELLTRCPALHVVEDTPALAGGWFRLIELRKHNQ